MAELSPTDLTKLTALMAIPSPQVAEIVVIGWGSPDGAINYSSSRPDILYPALSLRPIQSRLIPDLSSPLLELTRSASVSDDSVNFAFGDLDDEMSRLTYTHGEGCSVEVFGYYADVDLLLSLWRGALGTPSGATVDVMRISAKSGYRSASMVVPRRLLNLPPCQWLFGGLMATQGQIDKGRCIYNLQVGGTNGVVDPSTGLPWTDCARDSVATCVAHLARDDIFGGGMVTIESVQNNQTKGPNLLATTIGNTNTFADPVRVIFGERQIKGMRVIAFRPEPDTKHPDNGFLAALLEGCEGPVNSLSQCAINGVVVGFQHLNVRTGTIGQARTAFSPNIGNYSGTALFFGRIEGNYNNITADQISGTATCQGLNNIRVYTDLTTFTQQYTTNTAWCLLEILTNQIWGYGNDVSKYDIQSVIDTAAWCDQFVTFTDPNGTTFTGTRSTFNAELTGRAIQQQLSDLCTAARIGLPFEYNGFETIVPLRKEPNPVYPEGFTNYSFVAILGRLPTPTELSTWMPLLVGPSIVAHAKSLILGLFTGAEYIALGKSDTDFVKDLYWGYLHRAYDDAGLAFWVGQLGSFSRATIANDFPDADDEFSKLILGGDIPFFTDYTDDDKTCNIAVDGNGRSTLTRSVTPDSELVNQWTVSYDDASQNYASVSLTIGDMPQQLKAGKAWGDTSIRVINKSQPAFGITNQSEAMRFANLLLYLGHLDSGGIFNNLKITFTTNFKQALKVRNYKLIRVRSRKLERYGFDFFRVTGFVRKSDLTVEITAQAYAVDFYDTMESVQPPPIFTGAPTLNPGGGPTSIPFPIGFVTSSHTLGQILFELGTY